MTNHTNGTTISTCTSEDGTYQGELAGSLTLNGVLMTMLLFGTYFLIKYFSDRSVNWKYFAFITVAWVSGFVSAVYLPLDIALTTAEGQFRCCGKSDDTQCAYDWEDDLEICWTALYWFTFAMCWVIIPTVMEIYNAAEFTVWGRVRYSVCAQVKFFVFAGLLGAVVFGILIAQDPSEQVQEKLLSALMSLGNAYGLIMVVLLLGDGLARIPRDLWRASSAKIEEGRLCSKAGDAHIKLAGEDQAAKLKEVLRRVQDANLQIKYDKETDKWDMHMKVILEPVFRLRDEQTHAEKYAESRRASGKKVWTELDRTKRSSDHFWTNIDTDDEKLNKLVELHRDVRTQIKYMFRRRGKWLDMVKDFRFYKRVLDHEDGKVDDGDEEFRPVFKDEPLLYVLYWGFCICCCCCGFGRAAVLKLRIIVLRICALLFMCLSLIVISAEVTVIADGQQSLFGLAVKENPNNELGIFILTFLVFGYMSLCTYVSFISMSLPIPGTDVNSRNIVGNHLTSPYALLLFSCYLCRMQFALGYHFLNIMQYKGEPQNLQPSAFKRLYMANGDVSGLGIDWFFAVFPMGVVIMFILCLTNAYSYIMVCAGCGGPDDEVNVEGISQSTTVLAGRGLLRSEMIHLKRIQRDDDGLVCTLWKCLCCCFYGEQQGGEETVRLKDVMIDSPVTDSPMTESKESRGGMKIQLGTLKHRNSWGDDDDDDKNMTSVTVGTLEIGGEQREKKKVKTKLNVKHTSKGATRRYKVGSLHFGGKTAGGWFGSSSNADSCWVELDIKEKSLKWYQGDDSSGKMKGDVLMSDSTKIEEVKDQEHTFKVVDGPKTYVFRADSDEEMYGWMKELRKCVGMESPRRMSRSQSHATRMEESKTAILYFETKGMLGIKAVKRYVVLDKRKLEIHKGQNESTKILNTIMLEQDKFRVRKTRGKTKNTVNAIEIGEMNSADATIMFAAPNTFQQQDWYEELCKIVNEWKEDVWEEKKEEEIVQVRPATPSDAEEDEAFAPTKKTTTTTTTTENIFQSSLDDEDDGGDDALDDW